MKTREWRALPGGVLELGDTGVRIVRNHDPKKPPYTLFDPDGRSVYEGHSVALLKWLGEDAAAGRDEFEIKPEGPTNESA